MLSVYAAETAKVLDFDRDVKGHLRLDSDDEKARLVDIIIPAVIADAKLHTNLSMLTRTLRLTLDSFPCGQLELPRGPARTITHVKYIDSNGTQQTWSSTLYEKKGLIADEPPPDDGPPPIGRIYPAYGEVWPTVRCQPDAVEIQWTAGYTTVPALLKAAMLLMVGELFANREESTIGTIVTPNALRARDIYRMFRIPRYREGWAA